MCFWCAWSCKFDSFQARTCDISKRICHDRIALQKNPLECGLLLLPVFYFFCIALNAFMILYDGSPGMENFFRL